MDCYQKHVVRQLLEPALEDYLRALTEGEDAPSVRRLVRGQLEEDNKDKPDAFPTRRTLELEAERKSAGAAAGLA